MAEKIKQGRHLEGEPLARAVSTWAMKAGHKENLEHIPSWMRITLSLKAEPDRVCMGGGANETARRLD